MVAPIAVPFLSLVAALLWSAHVPPSTCAFSAEKLSPIRCSHQMRQLTETLVSHRNGADAGWVLVYDLAWPTTVAISAAVYAALNLLFSLQQSVATEPELSKKLLPEGPASVNNRLHGADL
jgi:hypothetical protein